MLADGESPRFRVNEPAVIHQEIDGELVIIHLDRGVYFSLTASGALMWRRLAAGESQAAVARKVAGDLGADEAELTAALAELIDQLVAEQLLVPVPGGQAHDDTQADAEGAATPTPKPGTFERPILQRYDDLQDLLLLDPIHAVDETGWPERRSDA